MKTLDEHNQERQQIHALMRQAMEKTDVACPGCGTEMVYSGDAYTTNVTCRPVRCPSCGKRGNKLL